MTLSYKYDISSLFNEIWSGDGRKLSLAIVVVALTVLVVLTSVAGRFLNVSLVQSIDSLAGTKLAEGGMKSLNIPL